MTSTAGPVIEVRTYRAKPGEPALRSAFYDGPDWTGDLEAKVMPLLDHYGAVVVEDTAGLRGAWPESAS